MTLSSAKRDSMKSSQKRRDIGVDKSKKPPGAFTRYLSNDIKIAGTQRFSTENAVHFAFKLADDVRGPLMRIGQPIFPLRRESLPSNETSSERYTQGFFLSGLKPPSTKYVIGFDGVPVCIVDITAGVFITLILGGEVDRDLKDLFGYRVLRVA
jgi:hypothetical protein